MVVADGDIYRETVPRIGVTVAEVVFKAVTQIRSEADIVEFAATIQRINALTPAHILAN